MNKDKNGWKEIFVGEEGMLKISNSIKQGSEFAVHFLLDPIKFCEDNEFTVYNGFGINPDMGRAYVFVFKINDNSFAIIWLYSYGNVTPLVVEKESLNAFIKGYDFNKIDNEIFKIWLKDNCEMIKKDYEEYKKAEKENRDKKSGT